MVAAFREKNHVTRQSVRRYCLHVTCGGTKQHSEYNTQKQFNIHAIVNFMMRIWIFKREACQNIRCSASDSCVCDNDYGLPLAVGNQKGMYKESAYARMH